MAGDRFGPSLLQGSDLPEAYRCCEIWLGSGGGLEETRSRQAHDLRRKVASLSVGPHDPARKSGRRPSSSRAIPQLSPWDRGGRLARAGQGSACAPRRRGPAGRSGAEPVEPAAYSRTSCAVSRARTRASRQARQREGVRFAACMGEAVSSATRKGARALARARSRPRSRPRRRLNRRRHAASVRS